MLSADFAYSSAGLTAKGKNPFQVSLLKHLKQWLGEKAKGWNDKQIYGEFYGDMMRVAAAERGESAEQSTKNKRMPAKNHG